MAEHLISRADAESDLLACAAYLAEAINSSDGRAQAMMSIVPGYLAKGDVDLAAELANTVEDPFARDRLLIAVAETCAVRDDDDYAMQLIEAMDDPGMQAQGRERIGLQLASQGKIDRARAAADEMEHRDNVLAGIAASQHGGGDTPGALETASEIAFPAAVSLAFVAMAAESIDKGDNETAAEMLDRAIAAAEDIEHEEERIRLLSDIGNSFIAAGRNDRAIETYELARAHADELDNVHRDNFLASISQGFMRAGSLELADRALDSVQDKTQIAATLLGFAREFWTRGEKEEAMDALDEGYSVLKSQHERETRDSKAKFAGFANIAVQYAGFEKGERAIGIAHEIEDEEQSMNALSQIARIMTIQKNDEMARQALNSIPDDAQRMFALIYLSDTAAANDETEKALALLEEANALAEEVPQLASRASAHDTIADRFFKLGNAEKARDVMRANLSTISIIKDESSAASALASLAGVYSAANCELDAAEREALQQLIRQTSLNR